MHAVRQSFKDKEASKYSKSGSRAKAEEICIFQHWENLLCFPLTLENCFESLVCIIKIHS